MHTHTYTEVYDHLELHAKEDTPLLLSSELTQSTSAAVVTTENTHIPWWWQFALLQTIIIFCSLKYEFFSAAYRDADMAEPR